MSIVDPVILFMMLLPISPLLVDEVELLDDEVVVDGAVVDEVVVVAGVVVDEVVVVGIVELVTLETIEKLLRLIS